MTQPGIPSCASPNSLKPSPHSSKCSSLTGASWETSHQALVQGFLADSPQDLGDIWALGLRYGVSGLLKRGNAEGLRRVLDLALHQPADPGVGLTRAYAP